MVKSTTIVIERPGWTLVLTPIRIVPAVLRPAGTAGALIWAASLVRTAGWSGTVALARIVAVAAVSAALALTLTLSLAAAALIVAAAGWSLVSLTILHALTDRSLFPALALCRALIRFLFALLCLSRTTRYILVIRFACRLLILLLPWCRRSCLAGGRASIFLYGLAVRRC